jgi:hypothetical protein
VEEENIRLVTAEGSYPYRLSGLRKVLADGGRIDLIFENQKMLFIPEEAAGDFAEALRLRTKIRQKAETE